MRLWSLPKVFHTCGKNCGKSTKFTIGFEFGPETMRISRSAKAPRSEKVAISAKFWRAEATALTDSALLG
jgi:hypothetical protein